MIVMYRLPGVAAGIALTSYVGLTLGLLNAFEITLTLPGIAGIILGIGMAVDLYLIHILAAAGLSELSDRVNSWLRKHGKVPDRTKG